MVKNFIGKFILIILAYILVSSILSIFLGNIPIHYYTILQILIFLIPVFYIFKGIGNPIELLKLNFNFSPKVIVFLLWAFLGISLFGIGWSIVQKIIIPESFFASFESLENSIIAQQTEIIQSSSISELLLKLLLVSIIPAFCEEVLFRGYLLENLKYKKYSNVFIVIFTSLCFTVVHFNLVGFVELFAIGIFLAAITLKTNSLIPAVFFHILNNAVIVLAEYFNPGRNSVSSSNGLLIGILFSVLGLVTVVISYSKIAKSKQNEEHLANIN